MHEHIGILSFKNVAIGVSGYYGRLVSLRLRVDSQNYENVAKWTEIYLKNIVFDASRIAICAKKLANAAADAKRDGYSVASFLSSNTIYDDAGKFYYFSNIHSSSVKLNVASPVVV
uniref:Uncharacterized protein n=1 Tax=Ditylenchus dipsaci TaxID=166011 RepID=A0A915E1U2_9BILA